MPLSEGTKRLQFRISPAYLFGGDAGLRLRLRELSAGDDSQQRALGGIDDER